LGKQEEASKEQSEEQSDANKRFWTRWFWREESEKSECVPHRILYFFF
jgi:hypothetical protein